jgi:hypothetical protein
MERAERIAFVELSDGHNELFRSVVQGLLVRDQLANGPKRGEDVQAAAHLADISERSLFAAASALSVRNRKGQWWLPR